MVLYDTPVEDVVRVMMDEREKVGFALDKFARKANRGFDRDPGASLSFDTYTAVVSRNRYTLLCINCGPRVALGFAFLTVSGSGGMNKVILSPQEGYDTVTREPYFFIEAFTGHFFSRYRERMGFESLSGIPLYARFFRTNLEQIVEVPLGDINLNAEAYDESVRAMRLAEGVSFASTGRYACGGGSVVFREHRTFLPDDGLRSGQYVKAKAIDYVGRRHAFEAAREAGVPDAELWRVLADDELSRYFFRRGWSPDAVAGKYRPGGGGTPPAQTP